jgi:glycosyltransferase involved in cell wall biosynthesis
MSAALTLIMPAWNAEKYIERSVRSVLDQSWRDLRLLVVDDGSTDGTAAILKRLAEADPRLTPMTVPNGGPGRARNLALDLLDEDTKYVMFIDADDVLLPDAAEKAVAAAEAGADLVLFGFSIMAVDGSRRDYCEPAQTLSRDELGGALGRLYKANLLNQIWAKLFRAEHIRAGHIRFPDYRWGEDRFFVFDNLERARRVAVLPDCLYRYIMHEGESLISKYYDRKFEVCLEIDRRMEDMCRSLGVTDERDFRYMFAKSVFSCLTTLYAPSCPLTEEEKRAAVKEIAGNERVRRRCRDCSGGLPVRTLCAVLRSGDPALTLAAFRGVAWMGRTAPNLFTRIKHRK